jgi:hypothetical protein
LSFNALNCQGGQNGNRPNDQPGEHPYRAANADGKEQREGGVMRKFIEVQCTKKKKVTVYRFFGLGEWKVKRYNKWEPVNGIYIPGDVLKIVAAQLHPPPILTEIQIAKLCSANADGCQFVNTSTDPY